MFQWTVQKASFWLTVKSFSAFSMLSCFITWLFFTRVWNLKMKLTKLPIFKEYSRVPKPYNFARVKRPWKPNFLLKFSIEVSWITGPQISAERQQNCSGHPWGRGRVIQHRSYVQLNRDDQSHNCKSWIFTSEHRVSNVSWPAGLSGWDDQSHSYKSWIFTSEHHVSNVSWPAALSDHTELLTITFREFSAFQIWEFSAFQMSAIAHHL